MSKRQVFLAWHFGSYRAAKQQNNVVKHVLIKEQCVCSALLESVTSTELGNERTQKEIIPLKCSIKQDGARDVNSAARRLEGLRLGGKYTQFPLY